MMDGNWDDKEISKMARTHNTPPEVSRDRMWEKIDAARSDGRGVLQPDFTPRRSPAFRIMRLAAGVAAILVLGVLIGRMTQQQPGPIPGPDSRPVAAVAYEPPDPGVRRDIYDLAARDLFSRADFLLTDFKVRSCGTDDMTEVPVWAGGMLIQTRLLMDTSLAEDVEMKNLLDELELVLAQIVGLSRDNCARDMAWIRKGLQEKSTIDRLRTVSAGDAI
jgi:hypothetical protein